MASFPLRPGQLAAGSMRRNSRSIDRLRLLPLACCLSGTLLASPAPDPASSISTVAFSQPNNDLPAPHNPAQVWTVKTCDDSGTDSLREIVQMQAQSGDSIDLSQLPVLCGDGNLDSKITLSTGEIVVAQADLWLVGPARGHGTVTISGGAKSRVFRHLGSGTLAVEDLSLADGYADDAAVPPGRGGCIYSTGSVYFSRARIANCVAASVSAAETNGGGIRALGAVELVLSTVSGNAALTTGGANANGGGVRSASLTMKYSEISGNRSSSGGGPAGAKVGPGDMTIFASAINENVGNDTGGLDITLGPADFGLIANSTISDNVGGTNGGVISRVYSTLTIQNTTIAFNQAPYSPYLYGGLRFTGPGSLTLESSIIANNTTGPGFPSDLHLSPGYGSISGSDNLVLASSIPVPPQGLIVVNEDPNLLPLQFNGGPTRSRAPSSQSPAIGMGNNGAMRASDQRGPGYPRMTGAAASVDIGAVQSDIIFLDGFNVPWF